MGRATNWILAGGVAAAAVACSARASAPAPTVLCDGVTVSNNVRVLDGVAFVRLTDMANAMNRTIVRSAGHFTLVRRSDPDSPSAEKGLSGNPQSALNKDVKRAGWTLRVLSASQVPGYIRQFGNEAEPVAVQRAGDRLVVARCRLTNTSTVTKDVYFDKSYSLNTALVDNESHGYPPYAYDSRNSEYAASRMLPGAVHEFALVFSVPAGTLPAELVYSVSTPASDKATDFTVAFAQ